MGGSSNAGDDSVVDSAGGFFSGSLKDRAFWLIVAVIAGVGGAGSFITVNDPRPDPWTGTMDREKMAEHDREIREYIDLRLNPFVDHIVQAEGWKQRVRDMEKQCALTSDRLDRLLSTRRFGEADSR